MEGTYAWNKFVPLPDYTEDSSWFGILVDGLELTVAPNVLRFG